MLSKLTVSDQKLVAAELDRLPADSLALLDASKVTLKTTSDFQMRFLQGCQGRYRRSSKELEVSRGTLAGAEKSAFFGSFGRSLATTGAIAATAALLAGAAGSVGQVVGLAVSVLGLALPAVSAVTRARGDSQTLSHEATHALDHAVGGEAMFSQTDPEVQACFARHRAAGDFMTPVAARQVEEFFAESGAAYLNTRDTGLIRNRQHLQATDPQMFSVMERFFAQHVPERLATLR